PRGARRRQPLGGRARHPVLGRPRHRRIGRHHPRGRGRRCHTARGSGRLPAVRNPHRGRRVRRRRPRGRPVRRFARLFAALDGTTRTNEKVAAMVAYFAAADPADAAWAVHFLRGERPRRLIPVRRLATWAMEAADVPDWLFEECYHAVGDLAETIALLLPDPATTSDLPLHRWIEERLLPLAGEDEETQRAVIREAWSSLGDVERFVWNKLITGAFRVGV